MARLRIAILAALLLAGSVTAGETQFVWQYPAGLGEPTVTVAGGHVTDSVWNLQAVFFDTPGDVRCYVLTARFPDGQVLTHQDTSACGAFLPAVVAP